MQLFERKSNVDECFPNLVFSKGSLVFGVLSDLLVQVSIIGVLHDDAENKIRGYQRELLSMKACLYPTM